MLCICLSHLVFFYFSVFFFIWIDSFELIIINEKGVEYKKKQKFALYILAFFLLSLLPSNFLRIEIWITIEIEAFINYDQFFHSTEITNHRHHFKFDYFDWHKYITKMKSAWYQLIFLFLLQQVKLYSILDTRLIDPSLQNNKFQIFSINFYSVKW